MLVKVNCFGNDIIIPECDTFIKQVIAATGEWEKNVHEAYKSFLTKDSIVIEVGAHVGTHTIPMAKLAKHVYTFEIQNFIHQLLCFNCINNECFNVTNFFEGVSNTTTTLPIEEINYDRPFNTGLMSLESLKKPWGYPLLVTKLDERCKFLQRCDLIKIDAEGFDTEVIDGAKNLIMQHKPRIMVEFHDEVDKGKMQKLLPQYKWEDLLDYYKSVKNKMMIGVYDTSA